MYSDGYKYWLAYKKSNANYFRCSRYKNQCPGRCVVEDGRTKISTPHNHPAEPDRALVDRFRKVLTQRAASEKTELHVIYWEEATQRHSDAALLYTFTQAESAMRKARRKQLPRAPTTIKELGDVLETSDMFRVHNGNNRDNFFQTSIAREDGTCVIFMHKKTLEAIGRIEELHVDASFYIQPQTPPTYFIFTAHSIQSNQTSPILFAITTNKNQNILSSIFAYLREQLSNYIMPTIIMSEFDYSMQIALCYTFPEATIKGNWYYYAEDVVNKMKHYELDRETAKGHGASALKMLMVLPLLPADYMTPGLEALKKWMQEKFIFSQGFSDLCSYIEHSWFRSIGTEKMSIFGLTNGLNNQVPNFNKHLRHTFSTQNATLWNILESLTSIATKNYVRLSKKMREHNSNIKTQPRKGRIVIETIIKNATNLWIRTAVHLRNPLQFLQSCSHCIQDISNFTTVDDGKSYIKVSSTIPTTQSSANTTKYLTNSSAAYSLMQVVSPSNEKTNNFVIEQIPQTSNQNFIQATSLPDRQFNYHQQSATITNQVQQTVFVKSQNISLDPPPLVFFRKPKLKKIFIENLSEPPPLVPIGSKK